MALGAGTVLLIAGVVGCNAVADDGALPEVIAVGTVPSSPQQPDTASSAVTETVKSIPAESLSVPTVTAPLETDSSPGTSTGPPSPPESGPAATSTPSADVPPTPTATPSRILLPTLGIEAPVVPVGVESDGLMEIPEDVATVGWYEYGPRPGDSAGSAVLTGHVNDRDQGLGVFARIGDLNPGDTLQVVDSVGTTRTFSVIARETWPKPEVPLDRLFERTGEPRLVLITCGGIFDRSSGNYQDNIAVTAVPVAP